MSILLCISGFSCAEETWLPVNESFKCGINVDSENSDENSSLNTYRDLVKIRRNYSNEVLWGTFNIHEKVRFFKFRVI